MMGRRKVMGKVTSKIFNLEGKSVGKVKIPEVFRTPFRPDIIKRAVVSSQSHRIQPQGRDVMAGKRTVAESWGVNRGMSRIPRLKGVNRAAFAPGTVGGRAAHPPVSEKKIAKKITKKEKRFALLSAIAATGEKEKVEARGHIVDDVPDFPLVVTEDIQSVKKVKDLKTALINLGVWPDVYRVKESIKVRAGKGKMRGRRKKQAVGPLIVINLNDGIVEAASNIPGVDVAYVKNLNAEFLAPGIHAGRLTVWTKDSIEELRTFTGGG
jgi:large subunit ribosomal protein L4e